MEKHKNNIPLYKLEIRHERRPNRVAANQAGFYEVENATTTLGIAEKDRNPMEWDRKHRRLRCDFIGFQWLFICAQDFGEKLWLRTNFYVVFLLYTTKLKFVLTKSDSSQPVLQHFFKEFVLAAKIWCPADELPCAAFFLVITFRVWIGMHVATYHCGAERRTTKGSFQNPITVKHSFWVGVRRFVDNPSAVRERIYVMVIYKMTKSLVSEGTIVSPNHDFATTSLFAD